MSKEKKSFLKFLNKRTRDENIRIARERKLPKSELEKKGKTLGLTKEQIKKKLKPLEAKAKKLEEKKKEKPFLVLKAQDHFLAERDHELTEEIDKSYIEESKSGDSLKDKGDLGQKNLNFSNVSDCPREIYYKFFEPERARDYTVKGLKLFSEGKRHHINLQRRLEDRGKARNPEGFLEIPRCGATGYYDSLINVGVENGWDICDVLEVKSKLPFACEVIAQRDYDQAQLYQYGCQFSRRLKTKKIKVRNIRILYRDRAVQTDEVDFGWIVKPDLERQHQINEYFNWLYDVVINQQFLCPHPFERKSTKCLYCRFNAWCWREFPEQVIEEKKEDPLEIKLPGKEIIDSYANKMYGILRKEAALKEEKKQLQEVILNYLRQEKVPHYLIKDDVALAPKQGKTSEWDEKGLMEALGFEWYAKISKPDGKKITSLIHREFVDASIFERYKKYKPKKPYLYIKKIKEEKL